MPAPVHFERRTASSAVDRQADGTTAGHTEITPIRMQSLSIIIGLALFGLFAGFMAWPLIIFTWSLDAFPEVQRLPFDSNAWKRGDPIERYRTVRSQMVDDLLKRRLLDGLSRADVEQLLGPPIEDLSGFKTHFRRYHLAYRLGLQRDGGSLAFYDEYLVIRLDDLGQVVEYKDVRN